MAPSFDSRAHGLPKRDLVVAERGIPGVPVGDAEKRQRLPEPGHGIGALGQDAEGHHRLDG